MQFLPQTRPDGRGSASTRPHHPLVVPGFGNAYQKIKKKKIKNKLIKKKPPRGESSSLLESFSCLLFWFVFFKAVAGGRSRCVPERRGCSRSPPCCSAEPPPALPALRAAGAAAAPPHRPATGSGSPAAPAGRRPALRPAAAPAAPRVSCERLKAVFQCRITPRLGNLVLKATLTKPWLLVLGGVVGVLLKKKMTLLRWVREFQN